MSGTEMPCASEGELNTDHVTYRTVSIHMTSQCSYSVGVPCNFRDRLTANVVSLNDPEQPQYSKLSMQGTLYQEGSTGILYWQCTPQMWTQLYLPRCAFHHCPKATAHKWTNYTRNSSSTGIIVPRLGASAGIAQSFRNQLKVW